MTKQNERWVKKERTRRHEGKYFQDHTDFKYVV